MINIEKVDRKEKTGEKNCGNYHESKIAAKYVAEYLKDNCEE
jgi:hypothetical protein